MSRLYGPSSCFFLCQSLCFRAGASQEETAARGARFVGARLRIFSRQQLVAQRPKDSSQSQITGPPPPHPAAVSPHGLQVHT